jgi:hypothetical protein
MMVTIVDPFFGFLDFFPGLTLRPLNLNLKRSQ